MIQNKNQKITQIHINHRKSEALSSASTLDDRVAFIAQLATMEALRDGVHSSNGFHLADAMDQMIDAASRVSHDASRAWEEASHRLIEDMAVI